MADQSWSKHVADVLRRNDVRMFATVPDYIVSHVLEHLWADPQCRVITVTREEEGVGLLSGAWLAGRRGALLMQNSGLGNCVNALASLNVARELRRAYDRILADDGPLVASVKIAAGPSTGRFDRDVVGHAWRFRRAVAELPVR